jgi:phosphoribosylaminoimidazole carboxylase (NCAIR synthetase)
MVDVMTVEIEHVNAEVLEELESTGHVIHPSGKTIRTIQV